MEDEGTEIVSEEERIISRHKKEKKELQAEIARLKHSVPKGDKKRKKDVTAQIAILESELDDKHEKELDELLTAQKQVNHVIDQVEKVALDGATSGDGDLSGQTTVQVTKMKKSSRAQKRRDKKAAEDRARQELIAQQDIENLKGARHIEAQKLKILLKERSLAIKEVPSDGNCLYTAIQLQLKDQGITSTVDDLRRQTASHMRMHMDDFLPFLSKPSTGDPYTSDEFEQYCVELETTPAWGGQLEINALSHVLRAPIEVIQADSPSIVSGEEHANPRLLLTYHRHMYGLGEHYNSIVPKPEDDEDDDDDFS